MLFALSQLWYCCGYGICRSNYCAAETSAGLGLGSLALPTLRPGLPALRNVQASKDQAL